MSDTPRTDAASLAAHGMPEGTGPWRYVESNFARQLERELTAAKAQIRLLKELGDALDDLVEDPPDRNCSCHICAQCNDCVDYGYLRELKQNWKEATEDKP